MLDFIAGFLIVSLERKHTAFKKNKTGVNNRFWYGMDDADDKKSECRGSVQCCGNGRERGGNVNVKYSSVLLQSRGVSEITTGIGERVWGVGWG